MNHVVQTRRGQVQGRIDRGVQVYRSIPYAQAPVGALRFQAPRPPEPWSGVRDARINGRAAPQYAGLMGFALKRMVGPTSEDCLSLNIWTPAADEGRRPVMVWIHGGAFVMGAGTQTLYDGAHLARRGDVVVVTINYRLGALGFLRLTELSEGRVPSTGNEGILDQIAALEWVRDEIARFGGDPGKVTIFGESAGAMSCATLLGTPRAQGLFHRAILQSGAANYVSSPRAATRMAEALLNEMGLAPGEVDALTRATPDQLVRGQQRLMSSLLVTPERVFSGRYLSPKRAPITLALVGLLSWRLLRRTVQRGAGLLGDLLGSAAGRAPGGSKPSSDPPLTRPELPELPLQPVVDGDLLPAAPDQAVGAGVAGTVSLLIGTNLDEMKLFMAMDLGSLSLDEQELIKRCEETIPGQDRDGVSFGRRAIEVYRAARSARGESVDPSELWYAIESDRAMRHPAMHLASLQSRHQRATYAYLFTWRSPAWKGRLGACHALELPFVFGGMDDKLARDFAGSELPGAHALATRIQDAWIHFARTGSPAVPGDAVLGAWPAYDESRRATMILDRDCRIEEAPREAERAFWDSLQTASGR